MTIFIRNPFVINKIETLAFILQFLQFILIFLSNIIFYDHVSCCHGRSWHTKRMTQEWFALIDWRDKMLNGKSSPAVIRANTVSMELSWKRRYFLIKPELVGFLRLLMLCFLVVVNLPKRTSSDLYLSAFMIGAYGNLLLIFQPS